VKQEKKKKPMEKAIYVKAPAEFVEMLNEAQWYLKMRPSQIVRKSVIEYLEKHLPKEVRGKIIKKSENKKT
jgi:hypothetical protein